MGKTAVMMATCMAEVAQSYIAQARSWGRERPMRARPRGAGVTAPDALLAGVGIGGIYGVTRSGRIGGRAGHTGGRSPLPGLRAAQGAAVCSARVFRSDRMTPAAREKRITPSERRVGRWTQSLRIILMPTNTRITAMAGFRYSKRYIMSASTKKSARRPRMAKMFEV